MLFNEYKMRHYTMLKEMFTYYVSRERGGIGQVLTNAEEGGRGESQKLTIADQGGWE